MEYYSHVLDLPDTPPYDRQESKFFSWIGNFVKPLRDTNLHDKYWFTYYDNQVKYRVYTDKYITLKPYIDCLIKTCGLTLQDEEKNLTLATDLGGDRFLATTRTDKSVADRAYLVLSYLHIIAELMIDHLIYQGKGYWVLESSTDDRENPNGSNFESLHHLFCNMTQVPLSILLTTGNPQGLRGTYWGLPIRVQRRRIDSQDFTEIFLRY